MTDDACGPQPGSIERRRFLRQSALAREAAQQDRLADNLRRGETLDRDVYDAVGWSAVTPLSQLSEAMGSAPVKFPDFTHGRWRNQRELPIMVGL